MIPIQQRVLGERDPETGRTLYNLACVEARQGRSDEAFSFYGRRFRSCTFCGALRATPTLRRSTATHVGAPLLAQCKRESLNRKGPSEVALLGERGVKPCLNLQEGIFTGLG